MIKHRHWIDINNFVEVAFPEPTRNSMQRTQRVGVGPEVLWKPNHFCNTFTKENLIASI